MPTDCRYEKIRMENGFITNHIICSIAPILLFGELKWENIKIITVCYNLVVATSAALIEELIFRETLITWIHKELQISEYKTVFFSSVLFAVAHYLI